MNREYFAVQLGNYLLAAREKWGLSLREVERLLKYKRQHDSPRLGTGASHMTLSTIEKAVAVRPPSPVLLYELARIYAVNYNELMRLAGYRVMSEEEAEEEMLNFARMNALAFDRRPGSGK